MHIAAGFALDAPLDREHPLRAVRCGLPVTLARRGPSRWTMAVAGRRARSTRCADGVVALTDATMLVSEGGRRGPRWAGGCWNGRRGMNGFDPLAQRHVHAVSMIAEEMGTVLEPRRLSPNIRERRDASSLFDAAGG